MNVWLIAAAALLVEIMVCGAVCVWARSRLDALVAVQGSSVLGTMCLLMLAQGYGRAIYFELSLVFAVLSFLGALVFVRFMAPSR